VSEFGQIAAHQGEMVTLVHPANIADTLHRILVAEMAAQGVAGIGGVHHHAAISDDIHSLADQARLGVVRVNGKKL
jgi:hypothetical protein